MENKVNQKDAKQFLKKTGYSFDSYVKRVIEMMLVDFANEQIKKISSNTKLRCENCKFILSKNCNNQESPFFNKPIPENKMCMFHST